VTRAPLRLAAAQYPVSMHASMAAWRDHAARWVAEGAATGARLLVFPEYGAIELASTFGREVAGDLRQTLTAVAGVMDEAIAHYVDLAQAHGMHILAPSGPVRTPDGRFVNSATLVTPMGHLGTQSKLMMTPFERDWGIAPGQSLGVFDTVLGRIGIAICYDSEFPLLVRALVEAGAELVLIPSCTERVSGYHRIRAAALARALESTIATVVAPTVGDALWSPAVDRNSGAAGVFVPAEHALSQTGVLAEGRLDAAGWVAAELDFDSLARLRSRGEMRNRADWSGQPGATGLSGLARLIRLG